MTENTGLRVDNQLHFSDADVAVSIVVPAFNVGTWVGECLRSLLCENRIPIEVIVVDDGSNDDTLDRAREIADIDQRVRVVRSPGHGGGQARNYGASIARGTHLMFCDADDLIPESAVAKLYSSAVIDRSDIAVGDFLKFSHDRTWSPTARWNVFDGRRHVVTLAEMPHLIRNRACWNRIFRRSFWLREGLEFPTVPRSNDIVPMTQALTRARRITVIPDIVYLYRQRPGTSSMTSRASLSEGSRSYLEQETICAALIGSHGSEPVNAAYWGMLLDSDLWVQTERYLDGIYAGAPASSEVEALLRALLERRRERSWARVQSKRQGVYSVFMDESSAKAASVLQRFRVSPVEDFGNSESSLASQLDALTLVAATPHPTTKALSELYTQRVLVPISRRNISASDLRSAREALAKIPRFLELEILLRSPTNDTRMLHSMLRGEDPSPVGTMVRANVRPTYVPMEVTLKRSIVTLKFDLSHFVEVSDVHAVRVDCAEELRIPLTHEKSAEHFAVTIKPREILAPGVYHVEFSGERDGQQFAATVYVDPSRGLPQSRRASAFRIRRPTRSAPLSIVRRRALPGRIGSWLRRELQAGEVVE